MFKKTILSNGLRIITTPMENTKAVTILVLVGTGSKYETKNINGISHFLEHLFFKGTKKRPTALHISKELDRIGGEYNAFTGKEETGFWVKVDSKHQDLAMDVLSDVFFNSKFSSDEMERERKVIFEEINMIKDSPQRYVQEVWENLLYGDQPAGWMISGTKQSVSGIMREDVLKYVNSQYVAKNMVISVAGNLDGGKMVSKLKKYFNQAPETECQNKLKVCEAQNAPKVKVYFKETDQAHLILGVRTFDLFDKRKYVLAVLSVLLGGIMSSRLFIALREKRGLCYYVQTSPDHYTDTGYLATSAGVDNNKIDEAIGIILKEYKNLTEKPVTKEELQRAKDNIKGHLYLGLETSDAWATYTGGQEMLQQKISSPEEEGVKIDKVTSLDILNLSREIFRNDKLNLALVGAFKEEERFQKLLKI